MARTNNYETWMKSREGLQALIRTYGNRQQMTVNEAITDFPSRVFHVNQRMVVAYDDDMLQTLTEMQGEA